MCDRYFSPAAIVFSVLQEEEGEQSKRISKICETSDIHGAVLQISLDKRDRDCLRLIWGKDGDPENLIIYRHCRVIFVVICSPFLLAAVLTYHLDQGPENIRPIARKFESPYI
ncbi:integrase catalytic domain-containing protein [Nephila pilipes]|uniref:Integrase catalytic domain-containing protein n=1 Tax=Nephila pilipes TaxID=299642 RepID=A0A8X6UL77_NEPPI|nr:integrase catalytic domain-containing protein [Nephila pilipes]